MNKAISTSVVKLDLRTILDNYKKPEFWSKEWLIIDTKWISIIWRIKNINCKRNFIESELAVKKINYKRNKIKVTSLYWYDTCECQSIPINNEEYTQKHFENSVFGTLIRLLNNIERYLTTFYSEYKRAQTQDYEYNNTLRKIAEDFLDENNVRNSDIREAYIDAYVSKVERESFTEKVISNFQEKLLTNVYIYASVWFNREDDFNKYCKKENRKSIYYEIKKEIDLIQTDEWNDSMRDNLEAI